MGNVIISALISAPLAGDQKPESKYAVPENKLFSATTEGMVSAPAAPVSVSTLSLPSSVEITPVTTYSSTSVESESSGRVRRQRAG